MCIQISLSDLYVNLYVNKVGGVWQASRLTFPFDFPCYILYIDISRIITERRLHIFTRWSFAWWIEIYWYSTPDWGVVWDGHFLIGKSLFETKNMFFITKIYDTSSKPLCLSWKLWISLIRKYFLRKYEYVFPETGHGPS
jgi:hypothetical protein